MVYIILGAAALILLFGFREKTMTFTVKCNYCGSIDVEATSLGLKCKNCGQEHQF